MKRLVLLFALSAGIALGQEGERKYPGLDLFQKYERSVASSDTTSANSSKLSQELFYWGYSPVTLKKTKTPFSKNAWLITDKNLKGLLSSYQQYNDLNKKYNVLSEKYKWAQESLKGENPTFLSLLNELETIQSDLRYTKEQLRLADKKTATRGAVVAVFGTGIGVGALITLVGLISASN